MKSYQAFKESPYSSIKISTYFYVYDFLFDRYKNKNITFVEIGVLGGGSLFMWRKFFGENARIIGIDLNPKAKKWERHGFEIFIGSQSDEEFWDRFIKNVGKIDIVLDDGGHTYEQQIITVEKTIPFINENGMIVIEDTHTSYMDGFGSRKYSFIKYCHFLIDNINYRFSAINNNNKYDERFWSIQFFESIVVFYVNNKLTSEKSTPLVNNGINDNAKDYRYSQNKLTFFIENNVYKFSILKKIPIVGKVAIMLRRFASEKSYDVNKIKKHFKL